MLNIDKDITDSYNITIVALSGLQLITVKHRKKIL